VHEDIGKLKGKTINQLFQKATRAGLTDAQIQVLREALDKIRKTPTPPNAKERKEEEEDGEAEDSSSEEEEKHVLVPIKVRRSKGVPEPKVEFAGHDGAGPAGPATSPKRAKNTPVRRTTG